LVDGQFIEKKKVANLPFVGSSNQRIINVKESLKANKIVEWKNPFLF
jgi:anaerobic ribonucleoside-triphosphate reductase activating protein